MARQIIHLFDLFNNAIHSGTQLMSGARRHRMFFVVELVSLVDKVAVNVVSKM